MAGILVSHDQVDAAHGWIQLDGGQEFVDVLHLGCELGSSISIGGIVVEDLMIFLQGGSATGCIRQDGVELSRINCVDVVSGKRLGLMFKPCMQMERAA